MEGEGEVEVKFFNCCAAEPGPNKMKQKPERRLPGAAAANSTDHVLYLRGWTLSLTNAWPKLAVPNGWTVDTVKKKKVKQQFKAKRRQRPKLERYEVGKHIHKAEQALPHHRKKVFRDPNNCISTWS